MIKVIIAILASVTPFAAEAQTMLPMTGTVLDAESKQRLQGATVAIYRQNKITSTISNREGRFFIADVPGVDSLKVSLIGYKSAIVDAARLKEVSSLSIQLNISVVELSEVTVQPMTAKDIVEKAIRASADILPEASFENIFFYRETIRDKENYFSVAEAVFRTQYNVKEKSLRLQIIKGRSKEDVSYTRLFEDFHPGGGPQKIADKSLSAGFPDFFNLKKTKLFNYHKEKSVEYDGELFYAIGFDQKPGVHEALEKGRLYINAADFTLLSYEAVNSPVGAPYIKNLTGTDKVFASLLNIDFKRKSWAKHAAFTKRNGKLVLSHAEEELNIGFRQPKKNLNLDLFISTEMAATDALLPLSGEITKATEWKQKNMVANLPTDYDADFWGTYNTISPSEKIENVIAAIGKKNNDLPVQKMEDGWQYFQKDLFVAYQQPDSMIVIPVVKASWENNETAGMLYKEIKGDFVVETNLSITKRSNKDELPENGFQQSGIIVRNGNTKEENSIILGIGTAGNSQPKIILRKTENGNSKGPVDRTDSMNYRLRIERKGTSVAAFYKKTGEEEWKKITTYEMKPFNGPLQVGLMVMARFAGNGPKMKPNMKAVFTGFKIISQ